MLGFEGLAPNSSFGRTESVSIIRWFPAGLNQRDMTDRPKSGMIGGDNHLLHAVRSSWTGNRALCGAGRIKLVLPNSQFNPLDTLACPACAKLVREAGRA